jgi:DNA-binding response OmpR family regulator
MSHLLLVDDDATLRDGIRAGIGARGYACDTAADAAEAEERLDGDAAYDLVLLDITLPDGSGWRVLEGMRERGDETPVIFLTARHAPEDRVRGLRLGADDYVVKPFDFEELVARVEAVLRRHRPPVVYVIDGVRVDLSERRVERDGRVVELSKREFDLLAALIEADGAVLSRRDLLERVWDMRSDPGTNVVDVVVSRVRRKLDVGGTHSIRTVIGEGYRVEAQRVRA